MGVETAPMVRHTITYAILFVLATAAVWPTAGCRSMTDPFLGVPEWKSVHYTSEDPHSPLHDVPRITAVETRDYNHYLRAAASGRLVAREFRDNWVYYGVATRRVVEYPAANGDVGGQRVAVTCERYKARKPEQPTLRTPVQQEAEQRQSVTTVKVGKDKDKAKKELEKALPAEGEVKVVTPEKEKKSGWFDWLKPD